MIYEKLVCSGGKIICVCKYPTQINNDDKTLLKMRSTHGYDKWIIVPVIWVNLVLENNVCEIIPSNQNCVSK